MPREPLSAHVRVATLGGDLEPGALKFSIESAAEVTRAYGEAYRVHLELLERPHPLIGWHRRHAAQVAGDESTEKRP